MNSKRKIIVFLLAIDFCLLILAFLNLRLFSEKASLPSEYQAKINNFSFDVKNIYRKKQVIEFDGKEINKNGQLEFYLLSHKAKDTVNVKSIGADSEITKQKVILVNTYENYELAIMMVVTLFFFFTGVFILIKYRNNSFSFIIHALSVCTGIMIIFDWGDLITYGRFLNFIIFLLFEISIYMVPALFLHLSFTYPVKTKSKNIFFLSAVYCAAITFIVISCIQLVKIFFFNADINKLYYLNFHTTVADVFLVIVIILTIAKFEHSALSINDVTHKKQIYWALSGITFGPLIYVFLCLIPRILMGYELVSMVFMQFTTIVAPIMLLISVTHNKNEYQRMMTKL